MKDNALVQKKPLYSTVRLGSTMVEVLKFMFPTRHEDLISEAMNDTRLLLVEFERLDDWAFDANKNNEVQHSRTLFSHLAVWVAVEMVDLFRIPQEKRKKGILVVSLLNSFLTHFAKYCESALPRLW